MKILIIRTIAVEENLDKMTYNNQEVGLATAISKLGHECALVYYAKRGNKKEDMFISDGVNLKVYHIEGKKLIRNALYDKELFKLCDGYDLIQVSECDQICSWQVYSRFPQKTVIYHGPYRSKFTWKHNLWCCAFDKIFIWRASFRNATIISKSYLAEKYLRKKGFKNVTTLGVGLMSYLLEQKADLLIDDLQSLIDTKGDNKYLLYIGDIIKRKNLLFLLQILDELVNCRKHSDYKLIIVGDKAYKEEKYFEQCFKYIKVKLLSNNVIYLGTLEQKYLKYLYRECDLFLLATQYDIFGMVYLEAMYFGIPILTTECGGSSLLLSEDETGFIRSLDKRKEWCDVVEKLLDNPEKFNNISSNSRLKIRNEYLWEKIAPKFIEVYKGLLDCAR